MEEAFRVLSCVLVWLFELFKRLLSFVMILGIGLLIEKAF